MRDVIVVIIIVISSIIRIIIITIVSVSCSSHLCSTLWLSSIGMLSAFVACGVPRGGLA